MQSFAVRNGLSPECGLTSSQGYIVLHGNTRFSWNQLKVGPGEAMTDLKITGNFASVHVVRGAVFVAGSLTAEAPLAVFGRQVTTTATGRISAPELVVSALLPDSSSPPTFGLC